jgi:hypothetical protein
VKLEDVYVAFGGDTKDLRRELKSLDATMRESQAVSANALRSIQGSFDAVRDSLGAVGVALSAGAIVSGVTTIIARMDDLADSAQLLGVSAESLQVFRLAAEANAGSAEAMDKGLKELVKTIGEARAGSQEAAKAFRELGLDDLVARGASVEDVMLAAAEAISKIDDPTLKAQAAIALFGKSGQDLVATLDLGSTGLRRFGDEARQMGQVVNDETVAQLAAAQDSINQASTAIANFSTVALASVVNFATAALSRLVSFAREVRVLLGGFSESREASVEQMRGGVENLRGRLAGAQRSLKIQTAAGLGDVITNDTKKTIAKLEGDLKAAELRLSERAIKEFAGSEGPPPPPKIKPFVLAPPKPSGGGGGGGKPRKAQARIGENDQPDYEHELLRDAAEQTERYNEQLDRLAETMRGRFGPAQSALVEAQENLNTLLKAGKIDAAEYAEMMARAQETIGQSRDAMSSAFDDAADAIAGAVAQTQSWDEALQAIGQSLLQLAQNELILNPVRDVLSGVFGALRADAGGWIGDIAGNLFGRAGGGPVNAGEPYMVGEVGPELFVPNRAGRIMPSSRAGGGPMNITVDLRGTTGDKALEEKLRAGVMTAVAIAQQNVSRSFGPMLQQYQLRQA